MKNNRLKNSHTQIIETAGILYSDNIATDSFAFFLLKESVYLKAVGLSSLSAAFIQAIVDIKSKAVDSEWHADEFTPLPANEKFASVDFRKLSADLQNLSVDLQKLSVDLQKFSAVLQNLSADLQNLSVDLQNLSADFQKLSVDLQNLSADLQGLSVRFKTHHPNVGKLFDRLKNCPVNNFRCNGNDRLASAKNQKLGGYNGNTRKKYRKID